MKINSLSTGLVAAIVLGLSFQNGRAGDKALPPAKTEGPSDGYRVEFKLVEVEEDTDVNALAIQVHPYQSALNWLTRGHDDIGHGFHPFTNLQCAHCHMLEGHRTSKEFFLKSLLDRRDALRTWVRSTKGVKVLASPVLAVKPDHLGTVNVKSPQKLQYFRPLKKGVFALEAEDVTTGITIQSAVQDAGEGKIRLKPLSVSVTAVKGRESLEGVELPVGKPILTTTSINTSVVSDPGKSSVISIDSPRGGRVLISVKVTRAGNLRGK